MTWRWVAAVLLSMATLGGCGGESVGGSGGGGGSGGTGGISSGGTGGISSGTGGGGEGGGAGGQGSGALCGGLAAIPCPPHEYCDFSDDNCGIPDQTGTCKLRPTGCPEIYQPTCACDGAVYGNACEASFEGHDVANTGGCMPPEAGLFGCGAIFCVSGEQYCQKATSDIGGYPDSYSCVALPSGCAAGELTCDCVASEPCGSLCDVLPSGDLLVVCLGG